MRPASRRSVQRPRSTGGVEQASAISLASCSPSSLRWYSRWPDPVRAERGLQALQDKAPPQALHGRDANLQHRNDPLVRPCWVALALVGLEQDLRLLEPADIGFAPGEPLLQFVALRCRQVTRYFFITRLLPVPNGPTGRQAIISPLALH
ncbi:MAG: hypothetical protein WAS21_26105 [Geminicoccaceae bacterium]